jgi:hypothetical protein
MVFKLAQMTSRLSILGLTLGVACSGLDEDSGQVKFTPETDDSGLVSEWAEDTATECFDAVENGDVISHQAGLSVNGVADDNEESISLSVKIDEPAIAARLELIVSDGFGYRFAETSSPDENGIFRISFPKSDGVQVYQLVSTIDDCQAKGPWFICSADFENCNLSDSSDLTVQP